MTARMACRSAHEVSGDRPPGADAEGAPAAATSAWNVRLAVPRLRPGRAILALRRRLRGGGQAFAPSVSRAADPPAAARPADEKAVLEVLERPQRANWRTWLRQLRLHQWLKNLLIFVPLVAARKLGDPKMLAAAAAAMDLEVEIRPSRIERASPEPFDVVTARACAPLDRLLSYAKTFQGPDTVHLFLKGQSAEAELTAAAEYWRMRLERRSSQTAPSATIFIIREIRHAGTEGRRRAR